MSEKGRNEPEMIKRIKYMEFCHFISHPNENICPVLTKYQTFSTLYFNGEAMFNIQYLYDLNKNSTNKKEFLGMKAIAK